MFKRLFWLVLGAGFGFGVSFWLMRWIRDTVERYSPEQVSANLADALRAVGQDLRVALSEGRQAMHEREEELLSELGPAAGRGRPPRNRPERP